jgi:hypothetical protein
MPKDERAERCHHGEDVAAFFLVGEAEAADEVGNDGEDQQKHPDPTKPLGTAQDADHQKEGVDIEQNVGDLKCLGE